MSGLYFMSGVMPVFYPPISNLPLGAFNYVGLTKREQHDRLEEHLYNLDKDKHSNKIIQDFYNQWGRGNLVTGAIIDCSEYYLNTMEKVYINHTNSFLKENEYGWNKSKGGEGAKNYKIPFSFECSGQYHYGTEFRLFLQGNPNLDPRGLLDLHAGKIDEFNGWTRL